VYKVYVIELDPAACARRRCFSRNGKPPIYVGQTWHALDVRFRQHKAGDKSAPVVERYGIRLVPEKCLKGIASRTEALEAELERASFYRSEGYCVFGPRRL
jgi:hypothetical protein